VIPPPCSIPCFISLRYKCLLVTKLLVYDLAVLFTVVERFYIKGRGDDEDKEKKSP
jgi:hypothetical protein